MITKIVSKIQKDKRPNATSVFKLFSLFMVRWQWHGQVNQLPCPSEGKQSKSKHSLIYKKIEAGTKILASQLFLDCRARRSG